MIKTLLRLRKKVTNLMFFKHFFVLLDKSILCFFISMTFTRDLNLPLKAGVRDLC